MKDIIKKILFEETRAKSFLLNNINQNGLLDSINRVGSYDKLRKILSNENFLTPDVMIKFISDVIDDTGYLTFFDLDLEPIIIKRTSLVSFTVLLVLLIKLTTTQNQVNIL
jgi:hypothetical protein